MEDYRQACQRQHQVLGHFLAVQAWLRSVECLVLERSDLQTFFDLKRIKEERVHWLKGDLLPWFPHQYMLEQGNSGFSFHSLYLSRVPISDWIPDGTMTTTARLNSMDENAPRTEVFAKPPTGHRRLQEKDVVRYLALLDSGLAIPTSLASVPKNEH